jgi:hypothetical protein
VTLFTLEPGRPLWRITLHNRSFVRTPVFPSSTGVGEFMDTTGRRLDQAWNQPAQLTFSLDGHSQGAASIAELSTDVIAWRWDDTTGIYIPFFRGPITQTEDQLTGDSHTVTVTAHDYLAMLTRRILNAGYNTTQVDQDSIASALVTLASSVTVAGVVQTPGSALPLLNQNVHPDGTARPALSGQLRDRSYTPQSIIGTLLDELANVINGFDYDCLPRSDLHGVDYVRVFYPVQGVTRSDLVLAYGANVSAITRTVDSAGFANHVRVLGNNSSTDPNAAQVYSERVTDDAKAGQVGSVGLWTTGDQASSDVTGQAALDDKANGDLALWSQLVPSYTLTLAPGWYRPGYPNMGDTVPLVIRSGRLNISTTVRVVGISYVIGDDGQEDVTLTVGRPVVSFSELVTGVNRDVRALARR